MAQFGLDKAASIHWAHSRIEHATRRIPTSTFQRDTYQSKIKQKIVFSLLHGLINVNEVELISYLSVPASEHYSKGPVPDEVLSAELKFPNCLHNPRSAL